MFSSGPPPWPHADVALLEVEQTHGLNEQGTDLMIRRLREQAGQIGCDGVVLGGFRERDGARPGSGLYLVDPGSTTLHATCIVNRERPAPKRAPSATLSDPPAPHQLLDREEPR